MMEQIFEHVLKIQEPTRGFSKHKSFKIGNLRRVKDEIVDCEGMVERAGVFFNKFMQAKEKYKNNKLGDDELRLLETEEIDFEDENLGVLNMPREERVLYFEERARENVIDDMPYASLDSLEQVFKLDANVGLEEKYRGRLEGIRDAESMDMSSYVEALIKDVEDDLEQAGYDLEIGSYMIGEEGDGTEIKIELKPLKDVLLPDSARTTPYAIKEGEEDEYRGILLTIESAIAGFYREDPKLKDIDVIKALKNLKKGLTKEYPAGCLEDQIQIRICAIASYKSQTRKEVQICLAYILKSVKLHRRIDGVRGYLNFIIDYA
ncbi:MAG: hypothetical protein U9N09_02745 [Euryarchaeota archaeon]|nr:hypothetical protein [Euryarchaeota archaeon]